MPYIVILQDKNHVDAELEAYRYGLIGVTDVDTPSTVLRGARIRVWMANTMGAAENQADRLRSGNFGAIVCETEKDLARKVEEWTE